MDYKWWCCTRLLFFKYVVNFAIEWNILRHEASNRGGDIFRTLVNNIHVV